MDRPKNSKPRSPHATHGWRQLWKEPEANCFCSGCGLPLLLRAGAHGHQHRARLANNQAGPPHDPNACIRATNSRGFLSDNHDDHAKQAQLIRFIQGEAHRAEIRILEPLEKSP